MKLIMMTLMVTMMFVTVVRGQKCQSNVAVVSGFSPNTLQGEYYEVYYDSPPRDFAYMKVKFTYQSSSQRMTEAINIVYEKPTRGKCSNYTFTFKATQAHKGLLLSDPMWSNATHTHKYTIYVVYVDNKYLITLHTVTINEAIIIPDFNVLQVFSKDIPLTFDDLPMAAKTQFMAFCGSTFNTTTLNKSSLKTNIPCTS